MHCVKHARKHNIAALQNFVLKCRYSRRSDKNTNSYNVVKSNGENLDELDGTVLETNSNWELLTPRGFRFYLPGSVGPGWSDVTTTAQVKSQFPEFNGSHESAVPRSFASTRSASSCKSKEVRPTLYCVAQECPFLLRKGIEELFSGCLDVASPQLTIVTIGQKTGPKATRWSKEMETERLVKHFVLAASDICAKLKMIGYWADFINPFSGLPHLSPRRSNSLYKTDERFRCLGFKVECKNSCKVISYENGANSFVGNLYTTAPASTEFLKEILSDCELVNVNEDE